MSIYNECVPSKKKPAPFKTVTIEYFEEFDKDTTKVSPKWQGPGVRRIRIVTTTRRYDLGPGKPIPVASVTYEYL